MPTNGTDHPDRKLLERLHDGDLENAERDRLERHLEVCTACRAYVEEMDRVGEVLREEMTEVVRAERLDPLWEGIERSIERPQEHLAKKFRNALWGQGCLPRPAFVMGTVLVLSLAFLIPILKIDPSGTATQCIVDSVDPGESSVVVLYNEATDTTVLWVIEEAPTADALYDQI
jgi:hypothetical protein